MPFDYSRIWPYAIAMLALVLVYRRLRRNFGRQLLRPGRMRVRIGLLTLVVVSLLPLAANSERFLVAELTGIGAGAALGLWGAQRTRFATDAGRLYYIPHTYSGIVVSLLLVGRLVYRAVEWYLLDHTAAGTAAENAFGSSQIARSPLTVGLLIVVLGYYVCFYGMVLWKSTRITPEAVEATAASTPAPP